MEVEIRPLRTLEEIEACVELQRRIWGSDDLDVVPAHVLITAAHNGGVLLGAFAGGQLVGFVFGFLGTDERRGREAPATVKLKHCSHQLGVLPEWQDKGIGYQLKLAQREAVRNQGLRLITWTYDPLESRNAYFNIAKLGAVCNTYIRNAYGELHDALNRGLPTDRFQVDWYIASRRVATRLSQGHFALSRSSFEQAGAVLVNPCRFDERGLPIPPETFQTPDVGFWLVEIPHRFQEIKRQDPGLARAWRFHTRELFETAFALGYLVVDFVREQEPGKPPRSFYALVRAHLTGREPWSVFARDLVDLRDAE